MDQKRILLIGLDPALVTFRPASGRDAEQVSAAGNAAQEQLAALGYDVHTCLLDLGTTAESVVVQTLSRKSFDCIMIGAGLRAAGAHDLVRKDRQPGAPARAGCQIVLQHQSRRHRHRRPALDLTGGLVCGKVSLAREEEYIHD